MHRKNFNNERAPPVKEGDIVEVKIESVGAKGDGIAKKEGFILFVPGVKKGDYVKIKVKKILPKAGFAELVERLKTPVRDSKFEEVKISKKEPKEEFNPHQELDSEEF